MKIVTGVSDSAHVTSKEFRKIMEGAFGQESYILSSGDSMKPEMVSNNLLKVFSGAMVHHGNISSVDPYDEIEITNGTQGVQRIDLVVNRYTKNAETGIENNEWVVIQGTPAESEPVAPEYTVGNMQDGDLIDDCPVFEIHFDGITVTEIKTLLEVAPSIDKLNNNTVGFIDPSRKLFDIIDNNAVDNVRHELWTATEDCWCVICAKAYEDGAYSSTIALDGVEVAWFYCVQYSTVIFPVKKGQTVTKGNGVVFAYFYGMS